MNGSGYAIAYLILYGGFALFVLAMLLLAWVLIRKGYKILGCLVLVGLVAAGVIPAAKSQWHTARIGAAVQAASFVPETLDFAGKRVIFVETESTICGRDICDYALRHGGLAEVYWAAADNLRAGHPELSWPFQAIAAGREVHRVALTDPEISDSGLALPDPVSQSTEIPQVDYTVLTDDSFLTLDYAEAFGLPEDLARRIRFSYMVFEGWPEPGQTPILRLLTAQYSVEPYFIWPVSSRHTYDPPLFVHRDRLRSWFCAAPMKSAYFPAEQCQDN